MMKMRSIICVGLFGYLLASCASMDSTSGKASDEAAKENETKQHLNWAFMGTVPDKWEGSIQGRSYRLSALNVSENRSTSWNVKAIGDGFEIVSRTKDPMIMISHGACVYDGVDYDYKVEIQTNNRRYTGCASNKNPEFSLDVSTADASLSESLGGAASHEKGDKEKSTLSTNEKKVGNAASSTKPQGKVTTEVSNELRWGFAGDGEHSWNASIVGRQFQFSSDSVSENRRLGWKVTKQGEHPTKMESTTGGIQIALVRKACKADGQPYLYSATIQIGGQSYIGCGRPQ